jgi:hypothetical protein
MDQRKSAFEILEGFLTLQWRGALYPRMATTGAIAVVVIFFGATALTQWMAFTCAATIAAIFSKAATRHPCIKIW